MRLRFDGAGDLVAASAPDRPRSQGRETVRTPWRGEFRDHRDAGGVRVPHRAEVAWDLPEGRFVYLRAEVTAVEVRRPV